MSTKKTNTYSPEEERLNVLSHGLGLVLSVIGVAFLLVKAVQLNSVKIFAAYLVYGIGVITMFLASTLYHSSSEPRLRQRLNVFDHSAIYLTISGSYTPICLMILPPLWGIPVLVAVWLIAIAGITLKFFFIGSSPKLSTAMYVLMGWVVVVAIKPLISSMETNGLIWLLAGGLSYTVGAVLYQFERIKYNHAIFHVFVLIGAACHYVVIYSYCLK